MDVKPRQKPIEEVDEEIARENAGLENADLDEDDDESELIDQEEIGQ